MQILQELKAGYIKFNVNKEDGTETFTTSPPTSKDLRAARTIEELVAVIQGLERSNATAAHTILQLEAELEKLKNANVQGQPASQEQPGVPDVSGNA